MEQESNQQREGIYKLVGLSEKAILLILLIGLILSYFQIPEGRIFVLLSLAGVVIVWFAMAFKPINLFNSQQEADEFGKWGFTELFVLMVVPRVLWISSAITAFGVFAWVADFGNDGFLRALTIGGMTILICLLSALLSFLMRIKKLSYVVPILYRAMSILLIGIYIVFYKLALL